ncbi:RHS repeat domain-containing protein [Microlunatus sp. Gsoil 973]|uniref:RHS repeat domain-containing protein n=1 Tax=Microlunatus sp. Gsoil 973 TaxID=2672569 RepID=UPI00351BDDAE
MTRRPGGRRDGQRCPYRLRVRPGGQLVEMRSSAGSVTSYAYDAAGRLVRGDRRRPRDDVHL